LERVCDRFEDAWRAGQRPRFEDYLGDMPEPGRSALLRELLLLELAYRRLQATDPSGRGQETLPAPRVSPPGIGTLDPGGYELIRELGRGGMGVVYEARQKKPNRIVALKMIRSGPFASPTAIERFYAEAEMVAKLDHPNIVPIYEFGDHHELHYFSMKLIEGGSLDKSLERYVTDPHAAARLMVTVARAVHHAHQRSIQHRDLKPSNILLDREGRPHVSDFGLAKQVEGDSSLTDSGAIGGTPAYMAPEQASGREGAVTTATDIYGLGTVLYALVTGRPPFQADTLKRTLERVKKDAPGRPSAINPRVGRNLEAICLKCLEKDPQRRYGSADALASDLDRWLRGEPILARRIRTPERFFLWFRRKPALGAAYGMVAAALVVVVVLSVRIAIQQSKIAIQQSKIGVQQSKAAEQAKQELAESALQRAQNYFDQGDARSGMLWLAESLGNAPSGWDLRQAIRVNLNTWAGELTQLRAYLTHDRCRLGVRLVAISPDGQKATTASGDGVVRLWNAATGQPIGSPFGHRSPINALAFSPDGRILATGSEDGKACLWDTATGGLRGQPLPHCGWVTSVAFSPDGSMLVSGCWDKTARLWKVGTGRSIGKPLEHQGIVWTVAFSPDGRTILTGCEDGTAQLWETASGRRLGRALNHGGPILAAAFHPKSKTVLTGSLDGTARLWEVPSGRPIGEPLTHSDRIIAVAFSPEPRGQIADSPRRQTAATASYDGTVRLWDALTGQAFKTPPLRHQGPVLALAFSPDGRAVLTGSADKTAQLWETDTGRPIGSPLRHDAAVVSVAVAFDAKEGMSLVTGSEDRSARLWKRKLVAGPQLTHGPVRAVAFCPPDGKALLILHEDGTMELRDPTTGGELPNRPPLSGICAVAFRPGRSRLVAGGLDGTVRFWEVATPETWRLGVQDHRPDRELHRPIVALAFDPGGRVVLTGDAAGRGQLWELDTGRPVGEPLQHQGPINAVAISPNGRRLLTGGADSAVRFWDGATGRQISESLEHRHQVIAVAFNPKDGRRAWTASWDETARCWDVDSGQALGPVLQHPDLVLALAVSPDGRTILTGCADRAARYWDAATGERLGPPLLHDGPVTAVAFAPDGQTAMTGSADGTTRRWGVPATPTQPETDEQIAVRARVITGMVLDRGVIRPLESKEWWREKLKASSDPPN
jgi:WD40 repeat protein/serine/threonine protein kinase